VVSKRKKVSDKNKTNRQRPKEAPSEDFNNSSAKSPYDNSYERIINEVEDYAIILLDTSGTIISWNKGAEKLNGYTASEIVGKNYKIFHSREDKARLLPETLLNEAFTKGKTNYEGWRLRKDGTRFWGSITLTAIHDDTGTIRTFLKVTKDLTDKKIAEDQFSNYVEELKIKNEELKKSEQRYHKMVSEVVDYAIILLDKDGKIVEWNKGAEKLKGYLPAEIIGKSFRLFYSKEDKDAGLPDQLLKQAIKEGHVSHDGWRIKKDGTRFWGSVVITCLQDDAGDIIGFSKVTRDLTAKKITEDQLNVVAEALKQNNEQLLKSEERYHKMISEVRDYAIILLSPKGDIENWNVGAQYIKGYSAKEIVGKNFRIFYPKSDRENKLPESLLEEAIKTGRAVHEGWRVRKDGSAFWGYVVITALHDEGGGVIGFSKVTRDLTERKKADEALQASTAQIELKNNALERLNKELSSFTFVASHDLQEPLRKILTYTLQMEKQEGFPVHAKAHLEKIKNTTARMQNLINDLLSYSHISNDKTKSEAVDLNEILQGVKNDLEVSINEKRAVIEPSMLPVLNGVRFQFHQLFLNLLSNSLKFSKEDEPPVIKIKARIINGPPLSGDIPLSSNKYHQITITDNGIGFDSSFSTKVFEPFERLHPKHEYSGTGIGLAIVKRVMQNHNGIVTADGEVNKGASFKLFFPFENELEG
jgi:PAS domain S-box-containing protein